MNQPRAVVAGDDLDASRKCGLNFSESLLHAINHRERVHAVTHDDDAADSFAFSVPFGNSFPNVRAKGDGTKVADEDRSAVFRCNRNAFEVLDRAPAISRTRPPTSLVESRTRSITMESGMLYARSLLGSRFT